MPVPHFNIKITQRSKGKSAVAGAAYQAGEKLFSEYDQKTKNYTCKKEVVYTEIMLPPNAPPEYADRAALWNSVEEIEKQWNSQLARRFVAALPREVPMELLPQMVKEYCEEHFVSKGMCCDFAIHDPDPPGHNPHCHFMLTMRAIDENGKWLPKSRKVYDLDENGERIKLPSGRWKSHKEDTVDWNEQYHAEEWRHGWEVVQNKYLELAGSPERIDMRSYERQGLDIIPTVHMGTAVSALERKGIATNIGNLNRDIKAANRMMNAIRSTIKNLRDWIADILEATKEVLAENEAAKKNASPNLAVLLRDYLNLRKAERSEWSRYGQQKGTTDDLKTISQATVYLQRHELFTLEDLDIALQGVSEKATAIREDMQKAANRMKAITAIQTAVADCEKHKAVHDKYIKIGWKIRKEAYLDQSGNPVEGLMEAIEGKRHWLENTDPMPVVKTEGEGEVTLSNGAISRTFAIPEKGGTGFYTKSYANTYIGKELVNGSNTPEVILSLYNKPYEEVYNRKKIIDNTPGYYFIGGENAAENTFAFDSYEIRSITADDVQFQWKKNAHSYSDPAAEDWPPKGMHAEFNFVAPSSFPADYQGLQVKVIYEMYDNCAVMKKRVEIVNTKDTMVMIGGLAPEVLSANGNDNMKELMLIQSDFTTETTSSNHPKEKCLCQKEPDGSPFKALGGDRRHICYDLGPAYEISTDPGKAAADRFISFNTYELIYSTYWLEQRALEEEGYYRKMFPWITDNPLTYHCTDYLTKEEIDMAVEGGFDMIIHSYNADGSSDEKQMLARDQKTLDKYKELVDYAHSRGIEVGMYQGHHKLNQYGSKYKPDGKPKDLTYGGNDGGKYGVFCMASAAFDDYWDNFRYFVEYTGLDCIEIDGAYGSWDCLNGEDHINEDKETDPDPNGVDKTTGDASKYRVHHGYFDSKVVQWENITRELCETFREMDTYIRVPSWWYAIGGNKNTIGYEEIAWSQPRQEQLIYGRQMIYNAGYARTMSMCWSHIPFSQYHGGGDSAAFLPFGEKIDDYNWVVAQNVGNGVTSDFRGKDLYDETVLPILTRWVNFFDRYRGIVNSDMVHISQARSEDNPLRTGKMDTLYHVNANNEGEKGLLWVYNQTDEERTEIITVPMYYTGLTELSYPSYPLPGSMGKNVKSYKGGSGGKYGWLPKVRDYTLPDVTGEITGQAAFLQEGSKLQVLDIDSNGNAQLSVTLAPMSFTYYTIYDPTEAPAVEMDIGAVTGLTGESQSSGVALTWNADASVSVKVNGVVDKDSTEIITGYRIYRDGELIGTALTNAFTDTSVLEELTTYTYTVKALVGVQEGAASDAAQVTTGADTTPPELLSVSSSGNKLVLTFSEVMAKAAAETLANYTLDQNVKVTGAALSADGKTVTLTVEGMESQKQYTLTVKNLTDNAKTPNPMADTEWTFINGYLAYYPMDGEELINSFSDSVANTQNVTYTASTGRDGCVYLNKKDKAYADLGYGWFSGSTDYSLALSVWPKDLSSARQAVLSSGQNGEPGDDFGIYLLAGKVVFTTSDASGEQVVELSSKKVLDADAWSRIMVTRSGDKFALYVNGELQEKVEKAGFPTYESKNAILLGAEVAYGGGDQTSYLWGRVDELVAYSNALSADAVTKDYDSYSPYTAVRPLIYMDFETADTGKVINLADGKEFTVLGNPQTETSFNDSTALKLENDGKTSSTYINMGQGYALGGEFTLSAWINVNCDNVKQMNKLICRGLVGNDAEAYYVCIRNQGYNIRVANKDKSALTKYETEKDNSKGYFPSKEWAHLTVICDGTTIRAYCNGEPAALTSNVKGALNLRSNTRDLLIGGAKKNSDGVSLQVDHFFNGSMDEFYLFDAALSEADIQDLMRSNTPVDKSNLQSLYDKYAEAEQGSYTDASWNALQDALAKAEKVLQDKDADQETVNEAYNLLQKAVNGLQQEGFEKVEGITNVGGFIDVKSTDWFAKAVQYAVDEGLMNGTSSNTFTPNGDTTRGMIVTILYRQAGSPRVKSDKATWWSDARVWAMECGVSDGTNMEKPITREQLATMLYRYAELNGKDVSKRTSLDSFKDGDKVSTYAVDALKWAVAEGIVTGKTGGFIDPQAGATRAETATMLMRFCEAFA